MRWSSNAEDRIWNRAPRRQRLRISAVRLQSWSRRLAAGCFSGRAAASHAEAYAKTSFGTSPANAASHSQNDCGKTCCAKNSAVAIYGKYEQKFHEPRKLTDVVETLHKDADYIAVFIRGGHGALMGLPFSADMKATLQWAMQNDRFIVTLCHGPAACFPPASANPTVEIFFAATAFVHSQMTWISRRQPWAICPAPCVGPSARNLRPWESRSQTLKLMGA